MASQQAHQLIANYRDRIKQITGFDPIEQVFSPDNTDPDTRYVWAGAVVPHITIGQMQTIDRLYLMWSGLRETDIERTQS